MGIGLALNFILSLTMESGFDTTVFICQLLDNIVAGIQEVSEKYLMYFEYESPFIILFYEGIFSFVLLLIIFLFDIFLSGNGINPTLTLIKENLYYLCSTYYHLLSIISHLYFAFSISIKLIFRSSIYSQLTPFAPKSTV